MLKQNSLFVTTQQDGPVTTQVGDSVASSNPRNKPLRYMLDSNVFDEIVANENIRLKIVGILLRQEAECFTTYVQEGELLRLAAVNPAKYWRIASVPRSVISSSAFILGHTPLGHGRLGSGEVYDSIRNERNHVDDGVIADTASCDGMVLVSNDKRLLQKAAKHTGLKSISSRQFFLDLGIGSTG